MTPELPRAVLAAGIAPRFLYWQGDSGERYLFTCIGTDALDDFETGVAMTVSNEEIVWVGDITALAHMPRHAAPRRGAIYVHLLAENLAARRAVIEDLRPVERMAAPRTVLKLAA